MILTFLFFTFICTALSAVNDDPNVVKTEYGLIRGSTDLDGKVRRFLGYPFAAPPVKELRFEPPQAPQPWSQELPCLDQGPACPQLPTPLVPEFLGSEDCLTLDIYAPSSASSTSSSPLPVLVWFYGGGYVLGDKWEFGLYEASRLVDAEQIIVVTVNYRLGALGFLALPELRNGGNSNSTLSTGNYALLDQQFALSWVKRNVAAFGGDPQRLLIAGESAGAISVCWHLASPLSRSMIAGAIMESGSCSSPFFFRSLPEAENFSRKWAAVAGCSDASISCLRALTPEEILRADAKSTATAAGDWPTLWPVMPWGAAIDGVALKEIPLHAIRRGDARKIPLLMGTNENEGDIFLVAMPFIVPDVVPPYTLDEARRVLAHFFNTSTVDGIVERYEPITDTSDDLLSAALRDFFFACEARRVMQATSAHQTPSFLYHYTYENGWIDHLLLGDYHSSELPFVFNNPWPPLVHEFSAKDKQMAADIGRFWSNMVRTGSPNQGSAVSLRWPQFNDTVGANMVLDVPLYTASAYRAGVCPFWDQVQCVHCI